MSYAFQAAKGYSLVQAPPIFGVAAGQQTAPLRPRPKTIVVLGSSNAAGVGASGFAADPVAPEWGAPATSWVGLLKTALGPAFTVFNRSITASTVAASINRFWTDVAYHAPSHVILATGLHNEGYDARAYLRGLEELIRLCRLIGAVPIVRGPSPYNAANATQVAAMLHVQAAIEGLDVLTIDAMSTLGDGAGKFVGGATYHAGDGVHPNDPGHAALFSAIDLGMFTGSGPAPLMRPGGTWQVDPAAAGGDAMILNAANGLGQALSSFTMRARIGGLASGGGTGKAFLAAYINGIVPGDASAAPLRLRNPSSVFDLANRSDASVAISAVNPTNSAAVHDCVVRYKHTTNIASLFIDGALIGSATLLGAPAPCSTFVYGARATADASGDSCAKSYRFADCQLWQVPLSDTQIADVARTGVRPRVGLMFDANLSATPRGRAPNLVHNGLSAQLSLPWLAAASM